MRHPYIAAAVGVALSTVVRLLLDPWLGRDAPLLVYVLGVSMAAVQAGVAAGFLATALSIPIGTLLFIEPRGALIPTRAEDFVRLAIFALEGVFISYATGQLRARLDENRQLSEQVRRHNEELETLVWRRTSELQMSNEALETFAHTISHDIRAPLRSIRGFAELLQQDHARNLPEEARDYTSRIANAAHRLEELVSNLLAYTRLGRSAIAHEAVPLDEVVASVLTGMQDDIRRAHASVDVEPPLGTVIGHADTIDDREDWQFVRGPIF